MICCRSMIATAAIVCVALFAANVNAEMTPSHSCHALSTMRRSLQSRFSNLHGEYINQLLANQQNGKTIGSGEDANKRVVRSPLHTHTRQSPPTPAPPTPAAPNSSTNGGTAYYYNVMDYGAVADGVADNTAAFNAALAAGAGSRVFVPAGTYNFLGTLTVPANTALVGVDEYPFRSLGGGSVLTVSYEGGSATGSPFLYLQGPNSGVDGLAVYYTKQNYSSSEPIPYPPCIQGSGDDVSVLNTLLVNPYIAIDFATYPCGRHLIDNVYGQPLSLGITVDQIYDIGRIRNVHFWTFFTPYPSPLATFIETNAVAFRFLRTDWEVVEDVFAFGYYRGMVFDQSAHGSCNGQFTNINFDDTGVGLHIRVTQLPGILFSNINLATDGNQGLGSIAVLVEAPSSLSSKTVIRGLSAWGNWQQHVVVNATLGVVSVSDSLFMQWNGTNPAVEGINGRLHLHNSFFSDSIGKGIYVHSTMDRAIVTGNDLVGNSMECAGELRVCANNLP